MKQRRPNSQRGATMAEFVYVAPALVLIGLAVLQYSLLYVAKNQVNHASFMAARAGSMHNATVESITTAYLRSLAPLYGGGKNSADIVDAVARATADMQGNYRIELINPTKASFDDFNDPSLKKALKTDARVIPNSGLAMRDPAVIKSASKQNIFDANLIKLRITHGYQPKVLAVAKVFTAALQAGDDGKDEFFKKLLDAGRVPVITDITLHMNSDAIEWANPVWISPDRAQDKPNPPAGPPKTEDPPASTPGTGVGGTGTGTGTGNGDGKTDPPRPNDEPDSFPGNGNGNGNADSDSIRCGKVACPVCPVKAPASETFPLSADVLFNFDSATLKSEGRQALDSVINDAKAAHAEGQRIETVSISGHTDQLGPDDVNQRLSEARAAAVRDYMKKQGFPDVPITVRGMGAADPLVALSRCTGRAQEQIACLAPNRRVVIEVTRTEKKGAS